MSAPIPPPVPSDPAAVEREINALANEAARLAGSQLDQAEALLRRALALAEQHLGDRHGLTATCANNLADILRLARRLDEAEPVARRAVALHAQIDGPDSEPSATALSNLALILRSRGDLAGAEPLYRRALAILEKAHGPDDPRLAGVLNNLAQVLSHTGRLAEAEPLMRRNVGLFEKAFGADHPNVAIVLSNLAGLLEETGRHAEAEPLSRRHLEIFHRFGQRQGQRHVHLDTAISNYDGVLRRLGLGAAAARARVREVLAGDGAGRGAGNGWGLVPTDGGKSFDLDLVHEGEPVKIVRQPPIEPPPVTGAESEFDILARAAGLPGATAEDRDALYGAAFRLKDWLFIARGELPNVSPYVASNAGLAGGVPMVKAFTDAKRLHAFAKDNGLCAPDGSAQILALPVAGVLPTLQSYAAHGVAHIHFNADLGSDGFFCPIAALPDLRRRLEAARSVPPPLPPGG